ncbi:hypothetical protein P3T27_002518 [Kitasatospora sp. MAA19]|nr:hypothetical protein [Kitasatospora sp. MAA19]
MLAPEMRTLRFAQWFMTESPPDGRMKMRTLGILVDGRVFPWRLVAASEYIYLT